MTFYIKDKRTGEILLVTKEVGHDPVSGKDSRTLTHVRMEFLRDADDRRLSMLPMEYPAEEELDP